MESHARSIVKGITWQVLANITTTSLVFGFTRDVTLSLKVAASAAVIKITLYWLHERAWLRVMWGRDRVS